MSKSKKFVFTTNNYEEYPTLQLDMKYLTYGKEIGDSGTPHLQGFVFYNYGVTLKKVIKDFPGSHVEIAKTLSEAIDYCHKDGDFMELGVRPKTQVQKGEGEVKRWELALSACKEKRFTDIPADIAGRNLKSLQYAVSIMYPPQLQDTEVRHQWYYGASGSGKSRKAREENPGAYLKMCNKWWDGYNGQETVIIEDFDKSHAVLCHHLKIWADRYPFPAEIKGAKVDIRPTLIIVTSNYHPDDIWTEESDVQPIKRRFHVTRFHKV